MQHHEVLLVQGEGDVNLVFASSNQIDPISPEKHKRDQINELLNNNTNKNKYLSQVAHPFSTKEIMACKVAEKPANLCSSPYLQVNNKTRQEDVIHMKLNMSKIGQRQNGLIFAPFNIDRSIWFCFRPIQIDTNLEYIGFPE